MQHLRLIEGGSASVRRTSPPVDPCVAAAARAFLHDVATAVGAAHGGPGGPATGAMLGLFVADDACGDEIDPPSEMDAFRVDPLHVNLADALVRLATAQRGGDASATAATAGAVAGLLCACGPVALSRVLPQFATTAAILARVLGKPAHAAVPRAVLPAIVHRVAATLSAKATAGRMVTSATVTRVTIRHAAIVLGDEAALAEAIGTVGGRANA